MITIKLIDAVNCKIQGLDADDRRMLSNKFSFMLPHARHTPAYKLGRWNGKVSFFQVSGSTYINLLDQILPILIEQGHEIELDDCRSALTLSDFKMPAIDKNSYSHITWPDGHQLEGQPIILNDHQVSALNIFFKNPQCLQELATGSGKTVITTALSRSVEPYGRSLIIVPNRTLVTQTEKDYVNMGLDVGVFFGGKREYTKTHTICTWQSLNSLFKQSKSGEAQISFIDFIKDVVCVIVDEAHMCKGDVLKSMLAGVMADIPIRWGLTGTIPKEEHAALELLVSIGPVEGKVSAVELQEKGILAQCNVNIKQLQDSVTHTNYQSELKYLLSNDNRLAYIATMIMNIAKTGNTLVLVDRVNAGKELEAYLDGKATFVSGATKAADRQEHYDDVGKVSDKILIATYGIAAVGVNIVELYNLVLIEPGKSFVRVIQSIGRGLRVSEDKKHAEIWDITSSCRFAKRHLTQRKKYYSEVEYPYKVEKVHWE